MPAFPYTKWYWFTDPAGRAGLTPAWDSLLRTSDFSALSPQPTFVELGFGLYCFGLTFNTANDPDWTGIINTSAPSAMDDTSAVKLNGGVADISGDLSGLTFPTTKRYVIDFLIAATGLSPVFSVFKTLASSPVSLMPPAIAALPSGEGKYYFDVPFSGPTAPDAAFVISGGTVGDLSTTRYGGVSLDDLANANSSPSLAFPQALPPQIGGSFASLGVDISCLTDLDPMFGLVVGPACLGQDLAHRFSTPRGGLPYDLDYGLDLTQYLNDVITDAQVRGLPGDMEAEAEKDPRVLSATCSVDQVVQLQELVCTLTVITEEGPFALELAVSSLTVDLLSATQA